MELTVLELKSVYTFTRICRDSAPVKFILNIHHIYINCWLPFPGGQQCKKRVTSYLVLLNIRFWGVGGFFCNFGKGPTVFNLELTIAPLSFLKGNSRKFDVYWG